MSTYTVAEWQQRLLEEDEQEQRRLAEFEQAYLGVATEA